MRDLPGSAPPASPRASTASRSRSPRPDGGRRGAVVGDTAVDQAPAGDSAADGAPAGGRADGHTSQCTYRCVVLPDSSLAGGAVLDRNVSMHLHGAP
mgnify:CR=1 FL=1